MLKKLLKYDFQAVFKYFIPMSIAMLVFSCLATLTFRIDSSDLSNDQSLLGIIAAFAIAGYIFIFIAYSIITQALIVINFFKSMATDTGYLTHTLPVKKTSIILSKVIMAEAVMLIMYLVLSLSLMIFLDVPTNFGLYHNALSTIVNFIISEIGTGMFAYFVISFIVLFLVAPLMSCSIFYVSIAFGQLMNRHKVIGSFVAYFVIMFVIQIISTIFSFFIGNVTVNTVEDVTNTMLPVFFTGFTVFELALSFIALFLTNWIFTKKLNLD